MYLRRTTVADLPLLTEMASRIWREHYPAIIGMEQVEYMLDLWYSPAALQRQMEEEDQVFWLLENDGQILGYLSITKQGEGQYYLNKFYLENGRRGQGLGRRAFDLLLAQYPDLQELRLNVNRRNFKSINFYFKLGFFIEDCMDLQIGQGYIMDDFKMLWRNRT